MRKVVFVLSVLLGFLSVKAQELNCQVEVIAPTLQSNPANTAIIESLRSSVFEFVNNTRWTNDVFQDFERIECSMLIKINEKIGSDQFNASIQVNSSRPVYNSNYKTQLISVNDENFSFTYLRNTSIVYQPDHHSSNLADVLAYYVYMILGYDYDSFSLEGGTQYFNKAQQIVTNCQNAQEAGWKPQDGTRNRYWLVVNHLQNLFSPLRQCYYNYHRIGMDNMYTKREASISQLVDALEGLNEIQKSRPNSYNQQVFFTAKSNELVGIFKDAPADVKNRVFNLLVVLDPGHINIYNKMK